MRIPEGHGVVLEAKLPALPDVSLTHGCMIPVEHTDDGVLILPLDPEMPRLFCDFPLLGTEAIEVRSRPSIAKE